jgi:hemolysin activation/secretion protein
MLDRNRLLSVFVFFALGIAASAKGQVHSYAEQFTAKEMEAKSVMRTESPSDDFADMPDGTEDSLEKEAEHDEKHESFLLKKIVLKGNTVYGEEMLKFLYEKELYGLTTIHKLKALTKKISSFYRKNGYILCRASLPKQDVLDGEVEIIIHERGINHIGFSGDVDLIDPLKELVRTNLKKSNPFRLQDLQTQINLLRSTFPVMIYPDIKPIGEGSLEAALTLVVKALPDAHQDPLGTDERTFHLRKIRIEGNRMIPTRQLELLFQKDLDEDITEQQLQSIIRRISDFYRAEGYVLSRAFLPRQDIKNGEVYVVVREGSLNSVALEGDTQGIDAKKVQEIQKAIDTTKPFHLKDLTRYVSLVQQLGHFHVYPSLKPLESGVKADLTFSIQAMKPEEIREELADKLALPSEFRLNKIEFSGNTAFRTEDLLRLVKDKIGKVVSLGAIRDITQKITRHYRQKGYILSQAILPPQDVENGVVSIKVIEGYISEVIFEGDTHDLEDFLAHTADAIKKSRPLHIKDLESHLLLLKDLPHLLVTSTMRPGKHVKYSSTLIVKLKKHHFEASISGNNYGDNQVGPVQLSGSLSITSPLNATHKINISGSKSYAPRELRLVQTGYSLPLGVNGTRLTLDAMISRSQPDMSAQLGNRKIYGSEERVGVSASVPIMRGRYHNLYGNLGFTSRNVISTSSIGLDKNTDRIRKLSLGFVFDFSDFFKGVNIFKVEGLKGLPVFGGSLKKDSGKSRQQGNPTFSLVNFFVSRDQSLFGPFSLYAMLNGQVSAHPLLSSERFRGGGMPYNKAYPNSVLTGDSGVETKLEFRYMKPMEHFLKYFMLYAYASEIQVWNRTLEQGEKKYEKARGIGLGARAAFQSGPTLELEYGRPTTGRVNNKRHKSKILMGFSYSMNHV